MSKERALARRLDAIEVDLLAAADGTYDLVSRVLLSAEALTEVLHQPQSGPGHMAVTGLRLGGVEWWLRNMEGGNPKGRPPGIVGASRSFDHEPGTDAAIGESGVFSPGPHDHGLEVRRVRPDAD